VPDVPPDTSDRNVLLVVVDCLRRDHVTGDAADTPFLDDLQERGLVATQQFATATTTSPAVASLLTGTYSERNGVLSLSEGSLSPSVDSFAERFSDAGYHTEAFVTGPLVEETGLDRGFDAYHVRDKDDDLFRGFEASITESLADLPEPFAALLHLWEIHEDVYVPPAFDSPAYGETDYARGLSALDRRLESVFEAVPEDTVVALVGDHGESITNWSNPVRLGLKALRDGLRYYGGVDTRPTVRKLNRRLADWGADVPDHFIEKGHGENVYDFVSNVPLVLVAEDVPATTVDAQTRQVDVLPTLLDLCDLGYDERALDGESLLPADAVADRPAYMRACGASLHRRRNWARAVRHEGAKYVEYPDRDWDPELYDLGTDPVELNPVDDPALAARLREHIPTEEVGEGDDLDIEERLSALGYR